METDNEHIIYTAEDIQRYLGGEMSPLEMNALEKAAIADPFLAEAIEGFESMKREQWQPQLTALRSSFAQQNNSSAKVIAMQPRRKWLRYAAALLIVGGAIGTYFYLNRDNGSKAPVLAENTKKENPSISAVDDKTINSNLSDSSKAMQELVAVNKKAITTDPKPIIAQNNIGVITTPGDIASLPPAKTTLAADEDKKFKQLSATDSVSIARNDDKDLAKKEIGLPTPATTQAERSRDYDYYANVDKRSATNIRKGPLLNQQTATNNNPSNNQAVLNKGRAAEVNKTFMAQVVDKDNNPLPFANISVTNQGFGTYTDVKGNVRLVSTDSMIPIEVKSLGYGAQNIVLHSNNTPSKIVLNEEAFTVSEKLNVKPGSNNAGYRRYAPVYDSSANAEPADGWDNYNTYVLNNIELPDEVVSKNLHGEVEVSFDVKSNGAITNIKVDKSLCNDCDEIAKRLVEQGPQWKVKKGKKAKVKVKVQF